MIAAQPSPTCTIALVNHAGHAAPPPAGADIVVDVDGQLVYIIVPVPGLLAQVRMYLTAEQLGALMRELVDASELVTG